MRSFLTLMFVALTFSSCINFTGDLVVNKELTLYHEGRDGKLYKRILPANSYQADFRINNRTTSELYFITPSGREVRTMIPIPRNVDIPRENGTFTISHHISTQTYDLLGDIRTTRQISHEVYYGIERCQTWDNRYICRQQCGPRGCRNVCRWERVYVDGEQRVEFRKVFVTKNMSITFVNPTTSESHGNFTGRNQNTEREYLYKGQCRPLPF